MWYILNKVLLCVCAARKKNVGRVWGEKNIVSLQKKVQNQNTTFFLYDVHDSRATLRVDVDISIHV